MEELSVPFSPPHLGPMSILLEKHQGRAGRSFSLKHFGKGDLLFASVEKYEGLLLLHKTFAGDFPSPKTPQRQPAPVLGHLASGEWDESGHSGVVILTWPLSFVLFSLF